MHLLGVKIGMTFSGGFIDYILYGLLNWDRSHALLVIPVGIVYAIVYYFLFDFAIRKFKLKTPSKVVKMKKLKFVTLVSQNYHLMS